MEEGGVKLRERQVGPWSLRDKLGRPLTDLRVSVTDRCNFRCFYCMPPWAEVEFLPREEILSFEEIARVVRILKRLGLKKVRITGGEPLLRTGIEKLVAMVKEAGIEDVALTTNGYLLPERAKALKEAGLKRVTVSLPTLKEEKFKKISKGAELERVILGIEKAKRAGLEPVKVNTVVVKGFNEEEILDIAEFCRERGLFLKFIEFMDVGTLNGWSPDKVVTAEEILKKLSSRYSLEPLGKENPSETALVFRYRDTGLKVGIIASVTKPFCRDCSRLRLSADGKVYTCLFASEGADLKSLLRGGASDGEIEAFFRNVWTSREDRYSEVRWSFENPKKVEMFRVGG